jgi:catechol 2,3-dioxygenase-like lactoylglutathione lyase family enzyme
MKLAANPLQVGIVTRDLDRAERFYTGVLGLPREGAPVQLPGGGEIRRLRCGQVLLKLNRPGSPPQASAPGGRYGDAAGIRYLTFLVEDARELHAELTRGGYALPGLNETPARIYFFAQDPDGNNLEFIQELVSAGS